MKKITIVLWFFAILSLFFYSFAQVDLNLTLIRHPFFNHIIKSFQTVGYFQRPLSTYLYLLLLFLLFILYFSFLSLAKKGEFSRREFWVIIIVSSIILLFSYPAFSYDIFNYMFDAKTIVFYHSNPWVYKPLYFVGDPWLHFMHWTHRPSVYPPVWIGLSLPFYFLGFNFFLPILINFKILMAAGFLGSIFVLEKLLKEAKETNIVLGLVFYSFSPLMLIENLVSGHNDIVMMFFILLSFLLALQKRKLLSIVFFLFSVLIKYVTVILFPTFLLIVPFRVIPNLFQDRYNKVLSSKSLNEIQQRVQHDTQIIYRLCLILVFIAFCVIIAKIEIQPWYLVWLMPFIVLSRWKVLWPVVIGFSLGLLLRYVPFLYFGDWNKPVPTFEFWLTIVPLLFSSLFILKNKLWLKK